MSEIKDMTIEEIEARSAEIVKELEGDVAEERLMELDAESVAIEARRTELKEQADLNKEVREAVANNEVIVEAQKEVIEEVRTMTNNEICGTKEYRDAFKNYILTGKDSECRALLTENASGNVPVPTIVYDIVKNAWEKDGIMSRVKKAYLKGNLKVGFEVSADGAVIHTEGAAAPTEEKLALGVVTLVPSSIKKWITISDEVIDLDSGAFLQYVYDEVAYQIAKKAADTLIAKIIACGTVSTNTPSTNVSVPIVEAASIGLGTIASALGELSDQAVNPVVIMNKATWSAFKAVQYAASFPVDIFEGLPVIFNGYLPHPT